MIFLRLFVILNVLFFMIGWNLWVFILLRVMVGSCLIGLFFCWIRFRLKFIVGVGRIGGIGMLVSIGLCGMMLFLWICC